MTTQYSSKLFTSVRDYRSYLSNNGTKLREISGELIDPLKTYGKSVGTTVSGLSDANRRLGSDTVNVGKTLLKRVRDNGGDAIDKVRTELSRTNSDVKSLAKQTEKQARSRLDNGVNYVKSFPKKLEQSIEIVQEAGERLRETFWSNEKKVQKGTARRASAKGVAKSKAEAAAA